MKTLLTVFACLLYAPFLQAEIVVVVPIDSSVGLLNEQQVSNLFLSKTNRFSNGNKAILLEIRNNQLRAEFYKHISNKTVTQLKSYWTTLIFTGKGKPPKSFTDKRELLDYMKSHTGAITYMLLSEVTEDMKIIYQISKE